MIKKGLPIKDSKVLILGITFKENCPDVRNTKVVDIVTEMQEYGCNVDITDPWADPKEVKDEYGFDIVQNYNLDDYKAVILAVSHDEFKSLDIKTADSRVVYDIKGLLTHVDGRL